MEWAADGRLSELMGAFGFKLRTGNWQLATVYFFHIPFQKNFWHN
jgi:hypothetical protein